MFNAWNNNTASIGTANGRIDAVETKNTEQDTAITRAQTVANNSYGGFGVSKTPQDVKLNLTKNNGDIDTFPILPVDTQNSGIVTPTMFNQWNSGRNFEVGSATATNTAVFINFKDGTNFMTLRNSGVNFANGTVALRQSFFWGANTEGTSGQLTPTLKDNSFVIAFHPKGMAFVSNNSEGTLAIYILF